MKKVFRTATRAWVGECQQDAAAAADVPDITDPRWIKGKPEGLFDVDVLTLSPFFPSGRLDVCVERKSSKPLGRYPNHPPFAGAVAWMPLGDLQWRSVEAS